MALGSSGAADATGVDFSKGVSPSSPKAVFHASDTAPVTLSTADFTVSIVLKTQSKLSRSHWNMLANTPVMA